jgi:RNA polymerase sigma-70 factor (ECF subfamily)
LLLSYRKDGDREAFEELVHRYERELYSYLRRYLGDASLAQDAFQSTFLQVHLKCKQFEQGRPVRPWLYTIATNQAIDLQRRNRRHRLTSLDRPNRSESDGDVGALIELLTTKEPGPASRLADRERQEWIRREVQKLPEALRGAVTLVYYQGMKYREAAQVLDIPVGTVKSRLHRALGSLRKSLTIVAETTSNDARGTRESNEGMTVNE